MSGIYVPKCSIFVVWAPLCFDSVSVAFVLHKKLDEVKLGIDGWLAAFT